MCMCVCVCVCVCVLFLFCLFICFFKYGISECTRVINVVNIVAFVFTSDSH